MAAKVLMGGSVFTVSVLLLLVFYTQVNLCQEVRKYSNAFDNLDIDAILKDDAERERYYACFMDTGPCHTDAALFFKTKASEAIISSCNYCTTKQLEMFEKIVSWYIENRPQDWTNLMQKTLGATKTF